MNDWNSTTNGPNSLSAIEDLLTEINLLKKEIEKHRMTPQERKAAYHCADAFDYDKRAMAIRAYLRRTSNED